MDALSNGSNDPNSGRARYRQKRVNTKEVDVTSSWKSTIPAILRASAQCARRRFAAAAVLSVVITVALAGHASSAENEAMPLKWKAFITKRPGLNRDIPAGKDDLKWVPNTATLIYGERDAILVDTFLTIDATKDLADWVAASGKNLTTLYITHAHGDHFFGIGLIQERFPKAHAIARPEVVEAMKKYVWSQRIDDFRKLYPGQIPEHLAIAEAMQGDSIELEGHKLISIDIGHTDTDNSSCLYVPSIGLVVAGDAAYNGVHPYLGETDANGRREWIAALDKMAALKPTVVIAGHKAPGTGDDPRIIEETRQYLRDFDRLGPLAANPRELYDRMLDIYPDRLNPSSLWSASKAAKPAVR
jgi:glyoxylase-like metal-dependent hydrolase (beta-lactamase superfamily II)